MLDRKIQEVLEDVCSMNEMTTLELYGLWGGGGHKKVCIVENL